ncbi:3-hydroxyacyl-CoA dehydrogenase NAD-binding domain-containing protein [Hyphococcus flavus]|uniref:enoyl-CoA hydratase n=1 Tax=Hyphococcus flavus TaxID=1866326 RepID=A0AAF0CFR5_9PROT|nr:3-hydroxyacyl-CoA dehydrogenase NAD-binding domain-containing protein [Hyphococcus flavus]WDI31333.1 3-hydroxyacyl-CoA dehydrogenase NAD-binding domain-containing protein [Hyphococcus flavus]
MTYKTIKVETDNDGIALVTIDLPGKSMNVWDADLIEDFAKWVDTFVADDTVKGAVITSSKPTGFLAGADLNMLGGMGGSAPSTPKEQFEAAFGLNRMLRKLETGGHAAKDLLKGNAHAKPVAAAVNGLALGGGLELVLACHHRVVADNPKIQLGVPEVQVGLLPGGGGTQRLPRLAGLQNAAMMATQGKPLDPNTAKGQGIIQEVVPADDVVAKAKEWVKANPKVTQPWDKKGFKFPGGGGAMDPRAVQFFIGSNAMAQKSTQHNYPAVQYILSCLYEGSIVPIDTALRIESKYFVKLMTSDQTRNMIRTLFINKQAAEKGEQRPKDVPPTELKKVGVLGAGMMGAGIAYVTAKGGMEVVLLDRDLEYAEKGKAYSQGIVEKGVSRGKVTKEKGEELLARITPTTDYSDLKDVDMIIEAVFEDPDIKADVIKKTEAVIGSDVIFASNTSTLPITGLAKHSERPDQFIGIHFFSPVDKMPLVEIIPGEKSGDKSLAAALDYVRMIKKTPIVVKDTRGFYTNRVVPPYINESMLLVTEGVNPALIENAAKQLGMPVGPLALCDETSQELGLRIARATAKETGQDPSGEPVFQLLETFVDKLGRKGRKSGGGFYEYPEGGKKHLWKGLSEYYPLAKNQPSVDEVLDRLLYAQLIPAAQCYEEGVVHDPQSADLGAIFGWGFAPWTGGPMSHIDTIGLEAFVRKAESLAQKHGSRFNPPKKFREMAEAGDKLYKSAA